jgi:hypothetical protein
MSNDESHRESTEDDRQLHRDAEEIYRQMAAALHDMQSRYTYFLLAAVGAGIALALNQTHDAQVSWRQVPLAGAVEAWALSFYFGCRQLRCVKGALRANVALFRVQDGVHPSVAEAKADIHARGESYLANAEAFSGRQFRMLIMGAVLYFAWHVIEMWWRTAAAPSCVLT